MKTSLLIFTTLSSMLFFAACSNNAPQKPAPATDTTQQKAADEEIVMGVLYQQRAAEYRALCLQAYNMAHHTIDLALKAKKKQDTLAVVTDLDETALDNSGYEVRLLKSGTAYSKASWKQWCDDAVADSVPGAPSFFNYADKKGLHIFYISNRDSSELQHTMDNMKKLGFPQVTAEHFMLHSDTMSKDARRKLVEQKYKIAALLGDDLIDLHSCYDNTTTAERLHKTDSMRNEWGGKYIVLPNAIYGDWENALYTDYNNAHPGAHLSMQTKDSIRAASMK